MANKRDELKPGDTVAVVAGKEGNIAMKGLLGLDLTHSPIRPVALIPRHLGASPARARTEP
jgi:hypothetical protein